MVNSFLSTKRNRSYKTLSCLFHKLSQPFKKAKGGENQFTNDTLFEHHQYQQHKQNNLQQHHGILLNKPTRHARQGSTQSAIVFGTQPKKGRHGRHYSHVSCISASNITVNSEDLTAKEFAEIAGIHILSDEEEEEVAIPEKKCAFCSTSDMSSSLIVTNHTVHSTLSSCSTSASNNNIWDLEFWKHPLQPANTFFKKGRFEISIGIHPTHQHSHSVPNITTKPVIEWKRKQLLKPSL
ncbi:hypothetical protein BY458DRAFT_506322 [Sporodiniella umbellata]|nr:hypothetical protein BY458DRAFT_506322 [Sporodiniella umbellata]